MAHRELTQREHAAIARLERALRNWPEDLWLFSDGSLSVMLKKDGEHATIPGGGGMDPEQAVALFLVDADGGDWE